MTANAKTCPSCGRSVPGDHTLCVKCGAKLDDPAALTGPVARTTLGTRQRVLATVAVVVVLTGLAALVWVLTADSPKPARRPDGTARTATDAGVQALPGPRPRAIDAGARPLPRNPAGGMRNHAPGPLPLLPSGADAGVTARPRARPAPSPRPPRKGFVADLRRCVDAARKTAEADCATFRRYLGHTAESACLWSKIVKRYWTCLKKKAKRTTGCVTGCAAGGAACVTGCVAKTERRIGESTSACLMRCWRKRIDPCLGKCTRP